MTNPIYYVAVIDRGELECKRDGKKMHTSEMYLVGQAVFHASPIFSFVSTASNIPTS